MKVTCHKILPVLICVLQLALLADLPGQFGSFEHGYCIDKGDGLPHSKVNSMTEAQGFLWFATRDGLARYDGSQFKVYQHTPSDPNTLVDNLVYRLALKGSDLWIGTANGLSIMDLWTNDFRNVQFSREGVLDTLSERQRQEVAALYLDNFGDMWVGTEHHGAFRYHAELDTFIPVTPDPEAHIEPDDEFKYLDVLAFQQDVVDSNIIWVGCFQGLLKVDRRTNTYWPYYFLYGDKAKESNFNRFRGFYQDPNGLLYCISWGAGLNIFDPRTESYYPAEYRNLNLALYLFAPARKIQLVSDSTLWITSSYGLAEYNLNQRDITALHLGSIESKKPVGADYIDSDGRIYVFADAGVFVYDPILQQFALKSFEDLNSTGGGYVYSVTYDPFTHKYLVSARGGLGIYTYDPHSQKWDLIKLPDKYTIRGKAAVNKVIPISPDKYIVGLILEVIIYNPLDGSFRPLGIDLPLSVNSLRSIHYDSEGFLWIATYGDGFLRCDLSTGNVRSFPFPRSTEYLQPSQNGVFQEDSEGNIWMKRAAGYSVYVRDQDSVIHRDSDIISMPVRAAFGEGGGRMWMACESGSIGFVDVEKPLSDLAEFVTVGNTDNRLMGMQIDRDGNQWFAMSRSLIKVTAGSTDFESFDYGYGENPNTFFSFQTMPDGNLVFGKRNGIVIVDPSQLQHNTILPVPYIQGIDVREKPIELDTVTNLLSRLDLTAKENFFTIAFSSIAFTFGNQNEFQWRLMDFQEEWVDARGRRFASYTNVPSGNYTFQLRAANNEGEWNPEILQLPVTIATPWWQQWWAQTLGVLALLGIVYTTYQMRVDRIRKEERLRSEFQRKLADVEMTALRAQMNPHFIFNCLNSIENYVIKNDTLKASVYLNDFARLIRLILQNSRSKYVPLEDELEALELYLQMESLRFKNKFQYSIRVGGDVDTGNLDVPPMLIQPYVENAIWHGIMHKNEPGTLRVDISRSNGVLCCSIEDDGVGRVRSQEIKAGKTKKNKSMGTAITQDRIRMLNELYSTNTSVEIIDLYDEAGNARGTRVELHISV